MMVNVRSILIFALYLLAHIVLLWLKPLYYMRPMEIGLQLLVLLPLLLADLKRARASPAFEKRAEIPFWVIAGCVLAFVVGGLAVNHVVTAGRMGGGDESAYRFQASIFASGHVATVAPPMSVEYTHHIINAGRWFTKYPPGWPAVLAIASAIGLATAINTLLGAITLWIVFCIARRIYSDREARLAIFLMVFSPFFFGNCLGHWSHPLCGCLLAGSTCF